ncbi:hypothetical protein [Spirillospora sp. CA-294931]|uniref:hypothetical protein n=1 Tax=Spirillospora sp. CA-294931 TaxID=3240042 RepID=UPI003D93504D
MTNTAGAPTSLHNSLTVLNTGRHKVALGIFLAIVLAHWAEHIAQAVQIWALGWTVPESRGVLGVPFPWLVTSEAMHYGYALVMLVGLFLLRRGFTGSSLTWWTIALAIQFWHHIEHLLLLGQAVLSKNLMGEPAPTSVIQLLVPRVELHLFYNTIVFIPMVIAMYLHWRPPAADRDAMKCSCAYARG